MNSLEQQESLLIGSAEAIGELAQKDESLILVISDSHGAGSMLRYILYEWGEQCDAFVFCGDGTGDVCDILTASLEDAALSRALPPVIALVQGNNDAARYSIANPAQDPGTPFVQLKVPIRQMLTASGHSMFITHGHRFSLYDGTLYLAHEAISQGAGMVLYGHTHIALAECSTGLLTLNPGSCAIPRGGLPPSFMTLRLRKGSAYQDYTFYRITGAKSVPFNPEPRRFYF